MSSAADEPNDPLGQFLLSLRARGYRDTRLLKAIEKAPRIGFVSEAYHEFAYQDLALPLPCGQQATAPSIVIDTVSRLALEPNHHVLEIGTGSGWQTAILAGLTKAVVSLERFQSLADEAEMRLQQLGLANVVIAHGDGQGGLPAAAPFDRILFNCAVDAVSPIIAAQLAEDGIVIAPILEPDGQFLTRLEWRNNEWLTSRIGPSTFPHLIPGSATVL